MKQFAQFTIGSILKNKRNQKMFQVVELLKEENKVILRNMDTNESVPVSKSTVIRWYQLKEVGTGELEKVENEEVVDEPSPKLPKVKKPMRPKVKKHVIEEQFEEADEIEEVEITEKPKAGKRSKSPKSDHVLALTKQLEARIVEAYPAAQRGVTGSFIKYHHKYNFVKIFQSKSKVRINVLTRSMPKDVKAKLDRIVPESYGWPIDGLFTIRREEDLDLAMELIMYSYEGVKK